MGNEQASAHVSRLQHAGRFLSPATFPLAESDLPCVVIFSGVCGMRIAAGRQPFLQSRHCRTWIRSPGRHSSEKKQGSVTVTGLGIKNNQIELQGIGIATTKKGEARVSFHRGGQQPERHAHLRRWRPHRRHGAARPVHGERVRHCKRRKRRHAHHVRDRDAAGGTSVKQMRSHGAVTS